MKTTPEAERLRTAFDLFEAGVRLMQARLQRSHPNASSAEIQALLEAWLREGPGAPVGDAVGRPVVWPRLP